MNGAQAIEKNGTIVISTRADQNHIIIEIEDDGPGIKKDILDKIFDPFFSTKEPGQGTGLGLSVSYGIIHEHNGDIRVQSTPGYGARFTITIPVTQENSTDD